MFTLSHAPAGFEFAETSELNNVPFGPFRFYVNDKFIVSDRLLARDLRGQRVYFVAITMLDNGMTHVMSLNSLLTGFWPDPKLCPCRTKAEAFNVLADRKLRVDDIIQVEQAEFDDYGCPTGKSHTVYKALFTTLE